MANGTENGITDLQVQHRITLLQFMPNCTILLVGFGNGTLQFYNTQTHIWFSITTMVEKNHYITCAAFSTTRMAVGCGSKIYIYEDVFDQQEEELEKMQTLKGHKDRIESLAFTSKNGQSLVSGGDKSTIFWNVL